MEEKKYSNITVDDFKLLSENEKIDAFKQILKDKTTYMKWWLDESTKNKELTTILEAINVVTSAGYNIIKKESK